MNHKKSRLTDLFRKMDKNNDGLIPREDFIDGIMKTSKQMDLLLTVLPSCLCIHVLVRNIIGFSFNPSE